SSRILARGAGPCLGYTCIHPGEHGGDGRSCPHRSGMLVVAVPLVHPPSQQHTSDGRVAGSFPTRKGVPLSTQDLTAGLDTPIPHAYRWTLGDLGCVRWALQSMCPPDTPEVVRHPKGPFRETRFSRTQVR